MRMAIFTMLLLAGSSSAADDFTVLRPESRDKLPRQQLHQFLLAECGKSFEKRQADIEKLKTPEDVIARQKALRAKFIEALGGFPEKTPLNARTVGQEKRTGYRIEKVIYESRPNHHVTATLYIPEGTGPFPAVLMPIGHSANGKAAEYVQRGSILLVKNGFVVLAYDPIGQGERSQLLDSLGNPAIKGTTSEHTMAGVGALLVGRSTGSYRIWDGIRSLDYLVSRSEVDARRIGCTGCSGGGTLTSYLMALDDRIAAAAPSCYLTTLERLFATIGPQDAEQNITGQVAFGMDHPDYVLLHAPKPTLICAATRDFFDIQGTWTTFREAKRVFGTFHLPERIDLMESDSGHGYPKSHREAVARFMNRWLRNQDSPVTEPEFPIAKDADLLCTRTGQVLEDLKGRSVFDLNASRAAELAKARGNLKRTPEEFRTDVAKVLGVPTARPKALQTSHGEIQRDGYKVLKFSFETERGITVPALLFRKSDVDSSPWVIYVHEQGKATEAAVGGAIEKLVQSGRRVLAVDLRGMGETAPNIAPPGKTPTFGVDYKESFLSLHLNRPLLGQRVLDLLCLVDYLGTVDRRAPVELIGVGNGGLIALHAAALEPRIRAVTAQNTLASWELVVRNPISQNQLTNAVPGVLAVYDLPELVGSLAPRSVTIQNPVDGMNAALAKPAPVK